MIYNDRLADTGWSIKRFIRTARRYRSIQIRIGHGTLLHSRRPAPHDLCDALALIK